MGTLGILAFWASINLLAPGEEPRVRDEGGHHLEAGRASARGAARPADADPAAHASVGLRLLGEEERLRRGEMVGLDTPVGRFEVMLLWSDAQLQLGTLEEPLDEAVVGFAPAGVFIRTERPTGRVVLSLPVLRF